MPPMPKAAFVELARICNLNRTRYVPIYSLGSATVLIDFSGEVDPAAAHRCFNTHLDASDEVLLVNGKRPDQIGYIWDTRK